MYNAYESDQHASISNVQSVNNRSQGTCQKSQHGRATLEWAM